MQTANHLEPKPQRTSFTVEEPQVSQPRGNSVLHLNPNDIKKLPYSLILKQVMNLADTITSDSNEKDVATKIRVRLG